MHVQLVVRAFKQAVKANVFGPFEAIAVRGTSGMLFGPLLAHMTRKRLSVIRKPNESAHTSRTLEGVVEASRYVIVDDFVSTGQTVSKIVAGMAESPFKPALAGLFTWNRESYDGWDLTNGDYGNAALWTGLPIVGVAKLPPYYKVCKCVGAYQSLTLEDS